MILLTMKVLENKEVLIRENSVNTIFFIYDCGIITLGGLDER